MASLSNRFRGKSPELSQSGRFYLPMQLDGCGGDALGKFLGVEPADGVFDDQ